MSTCEFRTRRLRVAGWHAIDFEGPDLADLVIGLLTPTNTRALPPEWHGGYSRARAESWIAERDDESTVLLAIDRDSRDPLGILILVELDDAHRPGFVDLRVGYLLAEPARGQGLASELIGGLVEWSRVRP